MKNKISIKDKQNEALLCHYITKSEEAKSNLIYQNKT